MVKEYPTRLHKDARILSVPDGWRLCRIGDTCVLRNNLRKPISATERRKVPGPYPYYGPTSKVDEINEYLLDGTYTLIGEDGDHFLKFDRMSMTQLIHGKSNVNNHAHILEGKDDCSTEWIFHFFRHRNIYHFLSRQGAGRYKLNKDTLCQLPILVPPLAEQAEIAKALSTWDRAIRMTDSLIVAKQKRKHALKQQLLTGKTRVPGFVGKWETHKAGEVFSARSIKDHPDEILLSVTQDRGIVRRDEMDRKIQMDQSTTGNYKLVEPNDYVISLRSFQGGLEMATIRGIVSPAYHVIRPNFKICPDFFRHFFKSYEFIGRLAVAVIGIRDGKQISFSDFAFMNFRVPPFEEQEAIANVLNCQDAEIEILKQKVELIQKQKSGLMQQLLTGKTRVKVAEAVA